MARQFKPGQLQTGSLYNISASYAITSSYSINGGGSTNTGSFVTTSSFNSFTASYSTGSFTGSFIGNGSGLTGLPTQSFDTSSLVTTTTFNAFTSSYTTGSFTGSFSGNGAGLTGITSASYSTTASYAPLYLPLTGGTISGDVTVLGTASIAFLNVQYESASVIYSSGSNQFGDATNDTQTLIGTVLVSGSQQITGSLNVTAGITGSLLGTASYASNALSASYAPSTPPFPYTGSALITGSLGVTGSFSVSSSTGTLMRANSSGLVLNGPGGTAFTPSIDFQRNGSSAFYIDQYATKFTGEAYFNTIRSNGSTTPIAVLPQSGTGIIYIYPADSSIALGFTTAAANLDIKTKGALSTDLALRVRNSADTANILTVNGDGTQNWFAPTNNTLSSIKSGIYNLIQWGNENYGNVAIGYNTSNMITPTINYCTVLGTFTSVLASGGTRIGNSGGIFVGGDYGIAIGYGTNVKGNSTIHIGRRTGASSMNGLNSIHLGKTPSGNDIAPSNVFMTHFDSEAASTLARGNGSFGLLGQTAYILGDGTGTYGVEKFMGNGGNTLVIANHASVPSSSITNTFQLYSSASSAGNASPHFRTEAGNIVKLYTQTAVTSSQGIADALTNLGFLTGSSVINPTASYATTASYALTASYLSGYVSPFPYTGSALITGSLGVTGSVSITQNLTASRAYISAPNGTISGSTLTVYGSGSSQPVFTVQGSQGELFSITDSLSGSLFSVNDISGLPIMEVFSDNTTLMGSYLAPSLNTTAKVTTAVGSNIIYSIPTSSYDGAWFEYTARSGSNARAGQIMSIWSGSTVNFTETTTTEFGDTTGLAFTVMVTGSNFALTGSSATAGWVVKTIIRSI